jgi:hypothetical protein
MITMHYSLPANNPGYGNYRHLVDYLGHKDVGGKTLVTIIDGIWAGRSWEGFVEKWKMTPFNNDYPSSLFISQDRVAIDAVCYDFLLEEYKSKPANQQYPYFDGCDDYLFQAADPTYWPSDIVYDPEGDGTPLTSMGVYEHWNNSTDKKYTRNLGTGNGIELVAVNKNEVNSVSKMYTSTNRIAAKLFPNPAKDNVNIEYNLSEPSHVTAQIFDMNGKRVVELINKNEIKGKFSFPWNVEKLNPGNYILQIRVKNQVEELFSTVIFDINR